MNIFKSILFLLIIVFALIMNTTNAQISNSPWPMFLHDPQHTGRGEHVGPESNDTKWIFTPSGSINGGPIIGLDGTIYIGVDTTSPSATHVYAIDSNGSLKWNTAIGFDFNTHSTPSAIASDGTIYVKRTLFSSLTSLQRGFMLYALNPNGTIKWFLNHTSFLDLINFQNSTLAIFESINPINLNIDQNGIIYFSALKGTITLLLPSFTSSSKDTSYLFSINPNGTLRWFFTFPETSIISDVVIGQNGIVYISILNKTHNRNNLLAFNSNGFGTMNQKLDNGFLEALSIGGDGTIYSAGLISLKAITPNGTVIWEKFLRSEYNPVIRSDGIIARTGNPFTSTGSIQFFDFNGNKRWEFSFNTDTVTAGSQPVIDANNNVYFSAFFTPIHTFYRLDENGKLKWINNIFSMPVIGSNTLYMIINSSLYAIGGPSIPPDSDNDGVPDNQDNCPNTQALPVDVNGCSQAQVDQDLDGICDVGKTSSLCIGSDACPNTEKDVQVDVNGCSQVQVDQDFDGICDPGKISSLCTGSDACPSEPEDLDGFEDQDGCPEAGQKNPSIASDRKIIFVGGLGSEFECSDVSKSLKWWDLWLFIKKNATELELDSSDLFIFSYSNNYSCPGAFPLARAIYKPTDTCDSIDMFGDRNNDGGHAQLFDNWFDQLTARFPHSKFDIIAHSMGGVIATYWASTTASPEDLYHVHSIVTLHSPLQGIEALHWLPIITPVCKSPFDPALLDMDPTSRVIRLLNFPAKPTDCGRHKNIAIVSKIEDILTVRNDADQIVPETRSCLPGSADFLFDDVCGFPNHDCAFTNESVRSRLIEWLLH